MLSGPYTFPSDISDTSDTEHSNTSLTNALKAFAILPQESRGRQMMDWTQVITATTDNKSIFSTASADNCLQLSKRRKIKKATIYLQASPRLLFRIRKKLWKKKKKNLWDTGEYISKKKLTLN
jgi:hypothetical protein